MSSFQSLLSKFKNPEKRVLGSSNGSASQSDVGVDSQQGIAATLKRCLERILAIFSVKPLGLIEFSHLIEYIG
jgi:hypothetical protein